MKDLKEGLSSSRKVDVTHVRSAIKRYIARACEWGSVRYERSNFLRRAADSLQEPASTRANFERLRGYLRAASSHIDATLDSMEAHQAIDPKLENAAGMKRAAYAEDTDAQPGCPHGHSGLPHLAGASASLMMAIEQATVYGLLPADPGRPWEARKAAADALTASLQASGEWRADPAPGPCGPPKSGNGCACAEPTTDFADRETDGHTAVGTLYVPRSAR